MEAKHRETLSTAEQQLLTYLAIIRELWLQQRKPNYTVQGFIATEGDIAFCSFGVPFAEASGWVGWTSVGYPHSKQHNTHWRRTDRCLPMQKAPIHCNETFILLYGLD